MSKEYVRKLRAIADFYEKHEKLELPVGQLPLMAFGDKDDMLKITTSVPGKKTKEYTENYFYLNLELDTNLVLKFLTNRETVCERKVVGTKVIPAVSYEERIEEIVEWKCHPLLEKVTTAGTTEVPF